MILAIAAVLLIALLVIAFLTIDFGGITSG
jgi:hypothetical protein